MSEHYGTMVAANAFFSSRLHSYDWDMATLADRTKALNQATEIINQFNYIGEKYSVASLRASDPDASCEQLRQANLSQENEFPRGTVNQVPVEIERACYLIAKALLSGRDPEADLESLSTQAAAYGGMRTTYDRSSETMDHSRHLVPSPQAYYLLLPFFREDKEFTMKRV